jgi:excisionase family DNA binding protein
MHPTQPLLPLDGEPLPKAPPRPRAPTIPTVSVAEPRDVEGPEDAPPAGTTAPPATQLPLLLTVRDVESEFQLGCTRVYELVRSGELPVVQLGRVVRVPRDGLERWIETRTARADRP